LNTQNGLKLTPKKLLNADKILLYRVVGLGIVPRKDDLGEKTLYIEEVPGTSVEWDWAGRDGSGNRRRVPPNYFITADNVRLEDGEAQGRKGLTKVNSGDSSDTSCTIGVDIIDGFPTRGRIFTTQGDVSTDGLGYTHIYVPPIDESNLLSLDPTGSRLAEGIEFLIKYNGNIYTDQGYLLGLVEEGGTIRASSSEQRIYPKPDSGSQMVVAPTLDINRPGEDDLYFISSGLPYRWDGNQSYVLGAASDFSSLTLQHIGYLKEQLFVVVDGSTEGAAGLFYRDFTGTWNSVNCPALAKPSSGAGTNRFFAQGITKFNDESLIHGYSREAGDAGRFHGTIAIWDGSTFTLGPTQTGSVGSLEDSAGGIFDATVRGNRYFYTYGEDNLPGGPFAAYIGRYTGSAWNNTYVDATGFLSTNYAPGGISARGNTVLVTSYDFNADTGSTEAWFSTATNLSSWTQITVGSAAKYAFPHRAFTF
jgi:hypothetical protein